MRLLMNLALTRHAISCARVPFGRDGDFARSAMIQRINSDLANDLGNLSNRVQSLFSKIVTVILPALPNNPTDDDAALLAAVDGLLDAVKDAVLHQQFHEALRLIWDVITIKPLC